MPRVAEPDGTIRPIVIQAVLRSPMTNRGQVSSWYLVGSSGESVVESTWRPLQRALLHLKRLQRREKMAKTREQKLRVQRWLEFRSAYTYTFDYGKESVNGNADFPSRLSLPVSDRICTGSRIPTALPSTSSGNAVKPQRPRRSQLFVRQGYSPTTGAKVGVGYPLYCLLSSAFCNEVRR